MRLAIIADIHGNYQALQAVLVDIEAAGVDEIISLGDNIGYGPQPAEVVRTIQDRNIISILGNHELGLLSKSYFNRLNPSPRESLAITRSLLDDQALAWIQTLPIVLIRYGVRFVHGSPPQSVATYLFSPSDNRIQRLFATFQERVCVVAHTHTLEYFSLTKAGVDKRELGIETFSLRAEDRYIIIPGSVGQPRDSINNHAKYLIWDMETDELEVRAVPYDVKTTVRLLKEKHFPIFNARRLMW